jgi:PIN domain nuclease of toxin-antitoxin system
VRLLLDTHTLLWWDSNDQRIGERARLLIADAKNKIFVSAVSAFEIATKHRIGKLPGVEKLLASFDDNLVAEGFSILNIALAHALLAGQIDAEPKDPFDRLLAAQSRTENMPIISTDRAFDALGAERLW